MMNWGALLKIGEGVATTIATLASQPKQEPPRLNKPCNVCPKMKFRGFGNARRARITINKPTGE